MTINTAIRILRGEVLGTNEQTHEAIYMAIKALKEQSAEPVVRCKDCVHCADDWNGNQPMFTCEIGMCGESVQPNDFCSYGERRSE